MNKLIIGNYKNTRIGFLLEDRNLVETISLSDDSILGNVYTARVVKIVKNIDAAFLDIGTGDTLYYSLKDNENRHIFIKHTANTDKVCEGDIILVQVEREQVKTKKAEATANIEFVGKNLILNRLGVIGISKKIDYNLRDPLKRKVEKIIKEEKTKIGLEDTAVGAVIRTEAVDSSIEEIQEETITLLCKLNDIMASSKHSNVASLVYQNADLVSGAISEISKRYSHEDLEVIEDDEALITFDIDTKLSKLMKRVVYLNSGAWLNVDLTEAMTVIDVNSGKAISGKDKEKNFLKINMEAADMIGRLLRVRNLSGMIIIDFISMKEPESYRTLIEHIKEVVGKDSTRTVYVDTTGLGLVELTRQKKSRPLHEVLKG